MTERIHVLFVCMGNICRSPTAEAVLRAMVREAGLDDRVGVDSAGTHAYHLGKAPDPRARATALRHGVDLSGLRARLAGPEDFERFDYVVAMDRANVDWLGAICPAGQRAKIRLLMEFAPDLQVEEVPDPYYGSDQGFEQVFDLVEAGAAGLLVHIRGRDSLAS